MSYVEIGVDKLLLEARKSELRRAIARGAADATAPDATTASDGPNTALLIGGGVLVAAGVAYFAMKKK